MNLIILGTEYTVIKKKYEEDADFKERSIDGYCDSIKKEIVYCDLSTYPGWERESKDRIILSEKQTIRHEIVHAFYNESGLQESSFTVDAPWARNEEMVDWIAIQGPKIYEAWKAANAL